MPNWCSNSLVFRGDTQDLVALFRKIHGDHCHLGLNKVIPEPPALRAAKSTNSLPPVWHDWRCENWGTKWDVDREDDSWVSAYIQFGAVTLSFETAWSPPLPVTAAIAKMFPAVEVDHLHCDEGWGAAGRAVWIGGKCISFRDFSHGTRDYDLATRGIRPEDAAVPECDWSTTVPTTQAASLIEAKSDLRPPPPPHPPTLESLLARVSAAQSLGELSTSSALALSHHHGFPLPTWHAAGLPMTPHLAWNTIGFPWSPPPCPDSSPLFIRYEAPPPIEDTTRPCPGSPPSLSLVEKSPIERGQPVRGMGRIVQLESGIDILSPSGWSASSLGRDGEAVVMVSRSGSCQTPPDGSPSCIHWKISPDTGRPFLFATAFCSGGKLWNPDKFTPAYTEFFESGRIRRTASFFAGKLSATPARAAVVEFSDSGPLLSPARIGQSRKIRSLSKGQSL